MLIYELKLIPETSTLTKSIHEGSYGTSAKMSGAQQKMFFPMNVSFLPANCSFCYEKIQ